MGDKNISHPSFLKRVDEASARVSKSQSSEIEWHKLEHAKDEDNKAFQQQQSTISWIKRLGRYWLGFVICAFSVLSFFHIRSQYFSLGAESGSTSFLGASSVAIALIAAGVLLLQVLCWWFMRSFERSLLQVACYRVARK